MATGTWETLPLATATIGPECWRDATVKNIKVSQNVMHKSDKGTDLGRQLDPLPTLRDNCAQQSNAKVHSYVRQTRSVVVKLRENLLDTNEEIKSLLRGKEALEKNLEHIRKDILLNKQSVFIRRSRPSREKVEDRCISHFIPYLLSLILFIHLSIHIIKDTDGADNLLNREWVVLLRIKRTLEGELRATQKQLQVTLFPINCSLPISWIYNNANGFAFIKVLASARKRLSDTLQERNRVLDLITHAVSSARPASGRVSARADTPNGRTSLVNYKIKLYCTASIPFFST